MTIAVDTSVAIPLLVRSHQHHTDVARWWDGQQLTLSGHALAETYSVLTRLPGDARLSAPDAAHLLDARFTVPLALS
uniref:PIN domain-containing protein n=1 Tax=Frankia gtarii TaxID=2950102 RepID=UPI0021C12349